MSRPKQQTETKRLIREHAGVLTSPQIAELAGVSASHVRRVAVGLDISLRKLPDKVNPKRIYWASAPLDSMCVFAERVDRIMKHWSLSSQSAALVQAVRFTDEAIIREEA